MLLALTLCFFVLLFFCIMLDFFPDLLLVLPMSCFYSCFISRLRPCILLNLFNLIMFFLFIFLLGLVLFHIVYFLSFFLIVFVLFLYLRLFLLIILLSSFFFLYFYPLSLSVACLPSVHLALFFYLVCVSLCSCLFACPFFYLFANFMFFVRFLFHRFT